MIDQKTILEIDVRNAETEYLKAYDELIKAQNRFRKSYGAFNHAKDKLKEFINKKGD